MAFNGIFYPIFYIYYSFINLLIIVYIKESGDIMETHNDGNVIHTVDTN